MQAPPTPTEKAKSDEDDEASDDEAEDNDLDEDKGEIEEEDLLTAAADRDLPEQAPYGFVVSNTKRGRFRRLHFLPDCHLVPGLHYRDFDIWGDTCPKESEIDAVCTRCLPRGFAPEQSEDCDMLSPSSSSSGEDEAATAAVPSDFV